MSESKADLILHPVRMRIISSLAGGRKLTVQQMLDLLRDIPQATLYRHLKKLAEADIISVVDEQQVRGAVQKTYTLHEMNSGLGEEDFLNATREDHMRYFMTFVVTLLDDFGRYLQQDTFDMLADGVGYRQVPLNLNDDELRELSLGINKVLSNYIHNRPGEGRKRRMLSSVIMPAIEPSIDSAIDSAIDSSSESLTERPAESQEWPIESSIESPSNNVKTNHKGE